MSGGATRSGGETRSVDKWNSDGGRSMRNSRRPSGNGCSTANGNCKATAADARQGRWQGGDRTTRRLKETVRTRIEDATRQLGGAADREADESEERREREEREVIERRRQLQEKRRAQEEAQSQREERSETLESMRRDLAKNHAAIRELQQRLDELEGTFAQKNDSDPAADLRPDLRELLIEEAILRQTHGPDHPDVLAIRKRMELIRDLQLKGTAKQLFPLLVDRKFCS